MFEVSVTGHFSAAHHLRDYPGKCGSDHGHNWEVGVFVQGQDAVNNGMLIDFRILKKSLDGVLDEIDHSDLNDHDSFKGQNPTSENIAAFLYGRLSGELNCEDYEVHRVTVHETPSTTATFWKTR